jgi:hypothetical protein
VQIPQNYMAWSRNISSPSARRVIHRLFIIASPSLSLSTSLHLPGGNSTDETQTTQRQVEYKERVYRQAKPVLDNATPTENTDARS